MFLTFCLFILNIDNKYDVIFSLKVRFYGNHLKSAQNIKTKNNQKNI
jgi:hypothetical protein